MKERPILFSGPMVRAILEGRKTVTRRVVKPQPKTNTVAWYEEPGVWGEFYPAGSDPIGFSWKCPYGQPGDRLWVRETWHIYNGTQKFIRYAADEALLPAADKTDCKTDRHWRSSAIMPRWASRLTLEIVSVRVEQLQDITEEEAVLEGCEALHVVYQNGPSYLDTFQALWDQINGKKHPWASNPWVWVIEFKQVQP